MIDWELNAALKRVEEERERMISILESNGWRNDGCPGDIWEDELMFVLVDAPDYNSQGYSHPTISFRPDLYWCYNAPGNDEGIFGVGAKSLEEHLKIVEQMKGE